MGSTKEILNKFPPPAPYISYTMLYISLYKMNGDQKIYKINIEVEGLSLSYVYTKEFLFKKVNKEGVIIANDLKKILEK